MSYDPKQVYAVVIDGFGLLINLYKNYKLHALVLNLPVSFYDLAFLEMQGVDN